MNTRHAVAGRSELSKGGKALFGILAPLPFFALGFWMILSTSVGEGPSVGGRGTVLALIGFPAILLATTLLNVWVLFVPLTRRLSAFLLGAALPGLSLALAYSYLWRIWPFTR